MPTYALLGATGTVGGHILAHLLNETTHKIRCFVRSRQKLLDQNPSFTEENHRITIYEGDVFNIDVLQRCIDGTETVFLCLAASTNIPGCRIAQDQAQSVCQALRNIRSNKQQQQTKAPLPRLVVLSSSETEPKFTQEFPWVVERFLFKANSNIYHDLIKAESYLRDQNDLVSVVFVKPGGLSHDISRGHQIREDKQQTFLSFRDLAAGMVEVADRMVEEGGDRWAGKSVSVVSPGGKAKTEWSSVLVLLRGFVVHLFPWLYSYIG